MLPLSQERGSCMPVQRSCCIRPPPPNQTSTVWASSSWSCCTPSPARRRGSGQQTACLGSQSSRGLVHEKLCTSRGKGAFIVAPPCLLLIPKPGRSPTYLQSSSELWHIKLPVHTTNSTSTPTHNLCLMHEARLAGRVPHCCVSLTTCHVAAESLTLPCAGDAGY